MFYDLIVVIGELTGVLAVIFIIMITIYIIYKIKTDK